MERLNIDLHFTQTEQWHKVTAEREPVFVMASAVTESFKSGFKLEYSHAVCRFVIDA